MGLKNKSVAPVAPEATAATEAGAVKAPTTGAKKGSGTKQASQKLIEEGQAIYAQLSDEQKEVLGSKSGTLHFQHLLGLSSKKSSRQVDGQSVKCSFPVGVELVTDEEIQVPVIDITLDKETGIDPAKDIQYRTVKAGEKFFVTFYELMFLVVRDEYAGTFEANGDPNGARFVAKAQKYFASAQKLPTPTLNLAAGSGSVKENMVDIDEKGADGKWVIKEPYTEKFTALIVNRQIGRSAGTKSQVPASTVVSLSLQKILGLK